MQIQAWGGKGEPGVRAAGEAESLSVPRMLRAPLSKRSPPEKGLGALLKWGLRALQNR